MLDIDSNNSDLKMHLKCSNLLLLRELVKSIKIINIKFLYIKKYFIPFL